MSRPASRTSVVSIQLLKGAILLGAAAAGMAQAQQSPALDRMSLSVGAFHAEPKIHLGGDTRYGRVETPDEKLGDGTLPRVKAELLFGEALEVYRETHGTRHPTTRMAINNLGQLLEEKGDLAWLSALIGV